MTTERWFEQDVAQPIVVQHCEGVVFTADNNGNIIGVKLYKDGTAFNPSGTATCNVIRPDGVTVSFDGTVSGNMISATLPVTALTVPGVIGVILQSISGSVVTTVFKGMFTCEMTTTETVVAPSVPTSSLAQLTQDVIDLQNGKVNKSGDTMTGVLAMPTGVVYGSGSYATLYFKNGAGAQTNIGYVGMNLSTRRLLLACFAPGNDNEIYYRLPAPAQNESGGEYDILTSKSPVTVAQGGTGETGHVDGPIAGTHANVTVSEVRLRRWGLVVTASGQFTSTAALNAFVTLFTLPIGFRSTTNTVVNTRIYNNANNTSLSAYTDKNGAFICRSAITANTQYWFEFSYVM